jgi:CubicO group peptidase (beta-lactamase class C family)
MAGSARSFLFVAALCAATRVSAAAQRSPAPPGDLDAYVARTLRTFQVPGAAVTIVRDGQVVLARGYGVRRAGDTTRVDAQTRFGIASNTKAFTATALALLVEDGKLEWDAPVVRYLPWFALSDPYVTAHLTIRDLLVHRSGLGLGAGDLLWWPTSTYDRREIARRLRFVPLATSFRGAYAYDNVLYGVAGEVIEAVSGATWEQFVQTRILDPLGMRHTTLLHSAAGDAGNVAATHALVDGAVRVTPPMLSDNTNPAGGVNTGAADIAKWLIVQLDSGRLGRGSRLFAAQTARELWSVVTPMGVGTPPPELAPARAQFQGYGLGFVIRDYRGRKIVTHTGGLPGYVSRVTLVPDLRVGIAVLTNAEAGEAFEAITHRILDHYLGAPPHDWIGGYAAVRQRADSLLRAAEAGAAAARDTDSRPSLPLARYAGTYRDAWYGEVTITVDGDRLVIRMVPTPELVGELEHWQHDTFIARWRGRENMSRELRADAFITFHLTPEGTIDQAKMRAVSPATDFSFDFHDLLLTPMQR